VLVEKEIVGHGGARGKGNRGGGVAKARAA